ncbi:MAG: signal peptide peptidase SppA [Elusimicrobiota bacterium]|nr:signal peptide peptidase SppA [Elusimicrobiota bacterium]
MSYVFIFLLLASVAGVFSLRSRGSKDGSHFAGKDKIGLVKIYGMISVVSPGSGNIFGLRGSDRWVEQLVSLRKEKVKAIVMRINSPGGTIGACQEIVEEIKKCREDGIPVVASLGDVAASGGYYIASVCDVIYLNPGTITGSIGVIMGSSNWEELLEKLGIKPSVVKSGKYKDMGAYYREMTDDERELLQAMIDDAYGQFLKTVSEGRGIPVEKLKILAQGQVFTGAQAIKNGLADSPGNLNAALEAAKELAGIKGPVKIIEGRNPVEKLFGIVPEVPQSSISALESFLLKIRRGAELLSL